MSLLVAKALERDADDLEDAVSVHGPLAAKLNFVV